MEEASRRQRQLLGVAAGAILAAVLVIPLALVLDNGLPGRGDDGAQPPPVAGPSFDPVLAAQGEPIFAATCSVCHGPDARGITGLGKTLIDSEFVDGSADADLVAFIATGRPADDPLNTTGIAMPARGGNPNLTDDDLLAIVNYIRSLN